METNTQKALDRVLQLESLMEDLEVDMDCGADPRLYNATVSLLDEAILELESLRDRVL